MFQEKEQLKEKTSKWEPSDFAVTSKEDSLIRTIVIIEMSACAAVATARQLREQKGPKVKAIGTTVPDAAQKGLMH